jgi:hypothetical protein
MSTNTKRYVGTCHCGAVKFAVNIDLDEGGSRCNCSICTKLNAFSRLMKPEAFELIAGESETSSYEWGHRVSRRHFCKHCGVSCFARGHLPEVGGDFVAINLSCLDGVELRDLKVAYWDGRHENWDAGARDTPWPMLGNT